LVRRHLNEKGGERRKTFARARKREREREEELERERERNKNTKEAAAMCRAAK